MMFQVGKMPKFGKYVQMFVKVSQGVIELMGAYVFLLVAFFCSFFVLFPNAPAFNPTQNIMGIIKVLVMMLGELEYNDLYYNQNDFFNASIFNSTNINNNSTVE